MGFSADKIWDLNPRRYSSQIIAAPKTNWTTKVPITSTNPWYFHQILKVPSGPDVINYFSRQARQPVNSGLCYQENQQNQWGYIDSPDGPARWRTSIVKKERHPRAWVSIYMANAYLSHLLFGCGSVSSYRVVDTMNALQAQLAHSRSTTTRRPSRHRQHQQQRPPVV